MSGWEVRFSNSKQLPYFYNASTSQSVWERPEGLTDDQIARLPGAQYLSALPGATGGSAGGGGGGGGVPAGKVRASHILAKHTGSRRPSSWREEKITRSLDQAREIVQAHRDRLAALPPNQLREEFAKIASTESDCSSASKGGDLGIFGKGQMQKAFEDATYPLEVGQMSELVESDSGVHIILRTG